MRDQPFDDSEAEPPSKSARKRMMTRLQKLAEPLSTLPEQTLESLQLSEQLRAALRESSRIRAHEARRRHFQYLGKLLRQAEIDPEEIEALLQNDRGEQLAQNAQFHEAERWRSRILAGDHDALERLLTQLPSEQEKKSAQTTVHAAMEARPGAGKRLFRLLYGLLSR